MSSTNPRTLSQVLNDALDQIEGDKTSIGKISDNLGTRAFGALIVLMTLLSIVPGVSLISGAFLFIFSIQMSLGIEKPWLPKFIVKISVETKQLDKAFHYILPRLLIIEKYIRPRLLILSSTVATRLFGLFITFFAFVIMLPIPFGNFFPSLALLFLAFGMLQKDGVTALISVILGSLYCSAFLWISWNIILHLVDL